MKLYSLTGTGAVSTGEGQFKPDKEGAFDFPEALGRTLLSTHLSGEPAWETDGERSVRLADEQMEKLRDPALQAKLLQELVDESRSRSDAEAAKAKKPQGK